MPKIRLLLALLVGVFGAPLLAHAQDPVSWKAEVRPADIRAGEGGRVVVSATIESGWYIYAPTTPPGGPNPTKITLAQGSPLIAKGKLVQPKPDTHFDEGFQMDTETFKKAVSFGLPFVLKSDASGAQKATIKARFQACNSRVCLPPKTVEIPVEFTIAAGAARPDKIKADESVPPQSVAQTTAPDKTDDQTAAPATPATSNDAGDPNGGDAGGGGTATGGTATGGTAPGGTAQDVAGVAGAATLAGKTAAPNLFAFVGLAFGAGLLAILTPCVFPMIPITVSLFSKQSEGNKLIGPLVYCGGIIGTFTLIGVAVSVLFGASGLSLFAANPLVNIALASLFFVLALNLFGVFEIMVPSSVLNRVQPKGKSGLLAPLLMGFAFTITSFTCTVPFVGTTLVSAATAGPLYPAIGMLAFSTAFALPFFLLALFPSVLSKLPRSGQWLVSVKAFMGFLELAAALKFLQVADYSLQLGLLTRPIFLAIWFTIAIVAGFYLLRVVRLPNDDATQKLGPGRAVLGAATLGVAGWLLAANNGVSLHDLDAYLPPRDYGATTKVASQWIVNDLKTAQAQATREGKPLLINFTGYACTNCRLMENNVLPHPDVKSALGDFVAVELFTDGSDEKSRKFNAYQQEKFGTVAIPYYAVVTPDGQIKGRLEGLERDPAKFTQFLQDSSATKVAARP